MNDIKRYQKKIRSLFPVYSSYEKRFYADLKNNIAESTKKFTDVNTSDLESEFGTPVNVIREYLSNVDSDYLSKQLSRSKYIRFVCIGIITISFTSLAIWGIRNYKAYMDFQKALPAIEETTIETNN